MQFFSTRNFAGAMVALALCTSSTGAIASTTSATRLPVSMSPMVALSALGSDASRTALCSGSAVAAPGAAAALGAPQGCALQMAQATAPAPGEEALPPPPVAPPPLIESGDGFGGVSPLLLGLAGVAAAVLLVVLLSKGNKDNSPT